MFTRIALAAKAEGKFIYSYINPLIKTSTILSLLLTHSQIHTHSFEHLLCMRHYLKGW